MADRSKLLIRILAGAIALGWLASGALAQDADSEADPPAQQTDPGSETDLPRGNDDDVFIPTEEIPADEEVTFPVDI
jgi:hypothetical protein